MKARTYIAYEAGAAPVRVGHTVSKEVTAEARIARLAASEPIAGGEVRLIMPDGTEQLYAVVSQSSGGNLLLKRIDGTVKVLVTH